MGLILYAIAINVLLQSAEEEPFNLNHFPSPSVFTNLINYAANILQQLNILSFRRDGALPPYISIYDPRVLSEFLTQLRVQDVSKILHQSKLQKLSNLIAYIEGDDNRRHETCVEGFGCVEAPNECFDFFPFNILFGTQTDTEESANVTFLIFSYDRHDEPYIVNYQEVYGKSVIIKKAPIDRDKRTLIFVHGFDSGFYRSGWMERIRDFYLNQQSGIKYNVIAVDWSGPVNTINYPRARAATRLIGAIVGLFINQLNYYFDIDPDSIQLMGHSLGAHIMGYAGSFVHKNLTLGTISHIIGLDPAGPCFGIDDKAYDRNERLDPSDGHLVEAYHTNAQLGGAGIYERIAHRDFYPNGGARQPGCPDNLPTLLLMPWRINEAACSHSYANKLAYADYRGYGTDCQPIAYNCDSYRDFKDGKCVDCEDGNCVPMATDAQFGGNSTKLPPGPGEKRRFWIDTQASAPFCVFHYQVILTLAEDSQKGSGTINITFYGHRTGTTSLVGKFEPGKNVSGLLLIPAELDGGGQPAPFSRASIKYTSNSYWFKSIITTRIAYNYMSDLNQEVRSNFSGQLVAMSDTGHLKVLANSTDLYGFKNSLE